MICLVSYIPMTVCLFLLSKLHLRLEARRVRLRLLHKDQDQHRLFAAPDLLT